MYCRNCGNNIKNKSICPSCGFNKDIGNTYCFSCGKKLPFSNILICQHCKTRLKENRKIQETINPKSRLVAGFLQIFFGIFGLGRFYMHSYLIGTLQLIVTFLTLGIGGLWGFIDGILILTSKINKDGLGNRLKD